MEEDNRRSKRVKAEDVVSEAQRKPKESAGLTELFKHKYILMATVVTWFNWFSVTMCYYGWSLMVGDVGGSVVRFYPFVCPKM